MERPSFKDFSSWRVKDISVKGFEVFTLDFLDTNPNQFVIQNPNDVVLYVGLSQIPTDNNYEFKVGRNATIPVGRPLPTQKLYIYNPLGDTVNLKVFSVYLPFEFSMLNNNTMNVEHAEIQTDGIVRGFANGVSIPSGSNLIGKVALNTDEKTMLETMYNWYNSNGETLVQFMELMQNYNSDLVDKMENLKVVVETLPETIDKPKKTIVYHNNLGETFTYTATEDCILTFEWLTNDGGSVATVYVNDIDKLTLLDFEKVFDCSFELKAGDVLKIESSLPMFRIKYFVS